MFRFVLITSLGVLLLRPAVAQSEIPALLSQQVKPGSAIARSTFASHQRDSAREDVPARRPQLQVAVPGTTEDSATKSVVTTAVPTSAPVILPPVTTTTPKVVVNVPLFPTAPTESSKAVPLKPRIAAATPVRSGEKTLGSVSPVSTQPKVLASREAQRERTLLARLDSNLSREEHRLHRAQARLLQSQRQLGAFTSVLRSAMLEAGDEGSGLHPFVRVAQRYVGTPYVWGGESARGFDCSGFIMRVMRDLGYRALPHSAAEQFRYGTPIARGLLKPGDIVFFANTYKPGVSHVGIYLGRGRCVHAANSKAGTIISSLHEPKWIAHYAGARRLIRAS